MGTSFDSMHYNAKSTGLGLDLRWWFVEALLDNTTRCDEFLPRTCSLGLQEGLPTAVFLREGIFTTSFPGPFIFPSPGVREWRPWLGLVTCLPESGRLQINISREGHISGKLVATQSRGERAVLLSIFLSSSRG